MGRVSQNSKAAAGGLGEVASNIRNIRTVTAGVAGVPALIAAIGGIVPVATAAAGATAQLALGLGQAAAGFGLIGGTALGGAIGGLKAYQVIVSQVVSDSRSAYEATHEQAMAQLEQQRNTILNTKASVAFNEELNRQIISLTKVEAEIGNAVLPALTNLMQVWGEKMPALQKPVMDLVVGITRIGESFGVAMSKGDQFARLVDVLDFVAASGTKAAGALTNIAKIGLLWANQLIPYADQLVDSTTLLIARFQTWTNSAQGVETMGRIFALLNARMNQLISVAANLGRGLIGVFTALNTQGGVNNMINGLVRLSGLFDDIMTKGNGGRQAIINFMNSAQPALTALGKLAGTAVIEFGLLANNLAKAGQSGGGIGTLAQVINGVTASIRPLRMLLQSTFISLGPILARLIPQVAQFAAVFLGTTGPLNSFLSIMTRVLTIFNSWPPGIKSLIANLIAMKAIMSALGVTTAIGSLTRLVTTFAAVRSASSAATTSQLAFSVATKGTATANTASSASAAAAGSRWGALGGVFRTIGTVLLTVGRFLLGPWGLAIAGLVAAGIAIYKNWGRIAPAIQPVIAVFRSFLGAMRPILAVVGQALTSALSSLVKGFMSVIAPGKSFQGIGVALSNTLQQLAARILPVAARAALQFAQFMQRAQPVLTTIGRVVATVLVSGFKAWGAVIRATIAVIGAIVKAVQALIKFFGSLGKVTSSALSAVSKAFTSALNAVRQIVTSVLNAVRNTFNSVLNGIRTLVTSVLNAVRNTWNSVMNGIRTLVTSVLNAIRNIWNSVINGIKTLVSSGLNAVRNTFTSVLNSARNTVTSVLNGIRKTFTSVINGLKGLVQKGFNAIAGFMVKPIERARGTLQSVWNAILEGISKVLGAVGLKDLAGKVSGAKWRDGGTTDAPPGRAFGRGGDSRGGVGTGKRDPRVHVWNEQYGHEAYIVEDRPTREQLPYLRTAAGWHGFNLVPSGRRRNVPMHGYAAGGTSDWPPELTWDLTGGDHGLGIGGSAARDALSATRAWSKTGVRFGHGSDVNAFYAEGAAAGSTSSNGQMRLDAAWAGDPLADNLWTHEIGHALRLGHGGSGIMPPVVNEGMSPSQGDIDASRNYLGITRSGVGPGPEKETHRRVPKRRPHQVGPSNVRNRRAKKRQGKGGGSFKIPRIFGFLNSIGIRPWALGGTTYNWEDWVADRVRDIEAHNEPTEPNTYVGHPGGEGNSADFWGAGGRGDPVGSSQGQQIHDYILSKWNDDLDWIIWEGLIDSGSGPQPYTDPSDMHYDHVHGTWHQGAGGATGGGSLWSMVGEALWNRLVQPKVDQVQKSMQGGFVLGEAAAAAVGIVTDGLKAMLIDQTGASDASGIGNVDPGSHGGSPEQNRALGEQMLGQSTVPGSWSSLDLLWNRESGWDNLAENAASGAYGIPQALPGSKMGDDANPPKSWADAQIRWGLGYILSEYGSTDKAWGHSEATGWYGRGGLSKGAQMLSNALGNPYSKGGIANGPQLAQLGERGYGEMVIPLGDPRVRREWQQVSGLNVLRGEIAGLRQDVTSAGIKVNEYGDKAHAQNMGGYQAGAQRFMSSHEGRQSTARNVNASRQASGLRGAAPGGTGF